MTPLFQLSEEFCDTAGGARGFSEVFALNDDRGWTEYLGQANHGVLMFSELISQHLGLMCCNLLQADHVLEIPPDLLDF